QLHSDPNPNPTWAKQQKGSTVEMEELMVDSDVMRLEVKRLRATLNGSADEVFTLENRKQQLAMSMREHKAEIQV
ncbi:unnamed protein product, partial [Discosporangium mesarthrocarpum]